ncbi:MAG: lytic transglycosylase domain-containing protein [Pseudomonadota bacterium]
MKRLLKVAVMVGAIAAPQLVLAQADEPTNPGQVEEEATIAPPPFKDFTFRRVKPPSGSGPRITVQIAPQEVPNAELAPVSNDVAAASAPYATRFDWFWTDLSADIADGGAGRLFDALEVLEARGDAPTPRLQQLKSITDAHGRSLLSATVGTRVSPALALAVISVESGGDVTALSRAGAKGLMQLMPDTAVRFGVTDAFDAEDNIKGGVAVLDHLMTKYDEDPLLVLAAYNAGEGAVRDHEGIPPYPETRDYIPKVLAAYTVARGLCVTPPLMLSDGCVFTGSGG